MRCQLLLGLAIVTLPSVAQAHSSWLEPPARTEDYALMEGPCGDIPRGEATQYTAGQVVQTRWASTQNHFNVFRVSFSPAADAGFEQNIIGSRPDTQDVFDYMQPLTMPMCTCDDCTLQLTQFTATGKLAYYSCADIELVAAQGGDVPPCIPATGESGESGEGPGTSTGAVPGTSSGDGSTSSSEEDTGLPATSESNGGSAAEDAKPSSSGGCRAADPDTSGRFALSIGLLWGLRRRRRSPQASARGAGPMPRGARDAYLRIEERLEAGEGHIEQLDDSDLQRALQRLHADLEEHVQDDSEPPEQGLATCVPLGLSGVGHSSCTTGRRCR